MNNQSLACFVETFKLLMTAGDEGQQQGAADQDNHGSANEDDD